MRWSPLQKAIFNDVATGSGHTVVEARAGSGKTTTLLEALKYIPEDTDSWGGNPWLLVAFNKRIAAELKARAPDNSGDIRTLHSLGLRAVKRKFPNAEVDADKMWQILNKIVGKDYKLNDLKTQMRKAVSLCKACLISDPKDIDVLLDDYDVDIFDMDRDEFIAKVNKALLKSFEITTHVDFDDMIWFCHMYDLNIGSYTRVFIDEAQDLNPAQIELALSACSEGGRITLFADRFQAIYGFRAASIDSVEKLIKRLGAKSLPLSISYRCPIKVIKKAKQLVPSIEAAPGAEQGVVEYIGYKEMVKKASPGCFILSRVNAPLIGLALSFIKEGRPCNIQGRDIGANLTNLLKKSRRKTIATFLTWLRKWEAKEVRRLRARNRPVTRITDKADCLRALANDCKSVGEIKVKIGELFDDDDDTNRIILSTVHRAKGLERDVVFLLNGTFFGGNKEEKNVKYVAITRSASELYYVTSNSTMKRRKFQKKRG
jgi:DNA helicase-2/ATP-dependent DNA helicase PcrA